MRLKLLQFCLLGLATNSETTNIITKCCGEEEVLDAISQNCIKWDAVGNGRSLEDLEINPNLIDIQYINEYDLQKCRAVEEQPNFNLTTSSFLCDPTIHDIGISTNSDSNNCQKFSTAVFPNNENSSTVLMMASGPIRPPTADFCIDRIFKISEQGQYEVLGTASKICKPKHPEPECEKQTCTRQCCFKPYEVSGDSNGYIDCKNTTKANATLFHQTAISKNTKEKHDKLQILYGEPDWDNVEDCKDFIIIEHTYNKDKCSVDHEDVLMVDEDGYFKYGCKKYSYSEYCIRHVEERDENGTFRGFRANVKICYDTNKTATSWHKQLKTKWIPALFLVSTIFLIILVCIEIGKNTSSLPGAMRLCTILHLLFFNIIFIVSAWRNPNTKKDDGLCITFGFLLQFSFVSAMSWMTANSFLIWSKFRVIRAPKMTTELGVFAGFRDKQFKWYGLVSWGIPTILTSVTALMQFLPREITCGAVVPGIGDRECYLEQKGYAIACYVYDILVPVLLANTIIFCHFTYSLIWGVWASDNAQGSQFRAMHKKQCMLVLKMFFVLGVTWTFEIIGYIMELVYADCNDAVNVIIAIFNVFNALQGFWMFLVITFDFGNILTNVKRRISIVTSSIWVDMSRKSRYNSALTVSTKSSKS